MKDTFNLSFVVLKDGSRSAKFWYRSTFFQLEWSKNRFADLWCEVSYLDWFLPEEIGWFVDEQDRILFSSLSLSVAEALALKPDQLSSKSG